MYSTGGEKRGGQGNWKGEKGKEKTRSKKVIVKVSVMADEEEVVVVVNTLSLPQQHANHKERVKHTGDEVT